MLRSLPISFRSVLQQSGRTALITSLAVAATLLGIRQTTGLIEAMEINTWDRMTRLQPAVPPDDRILIVGVTEQDLQTYGSAPLADETIAQLLTQLRQYQPRTIGLDIIRDLPQGEGRAQLLQILQQDSSIVVVCKVGVGEDAGYPPPPDIPASRVGASNVPLDPGGVLRRGILGLVPPESAVAAPDNPCQNPSRPVYSLGLQVARQYLDNDGIPLTLTSQEQLQLGNVVFPPLSPTDGGYQHADAGGYQMLLRHYPPDEVAPQVSLTAVLTGDVGEAEIRDRIVLIGYVAESVKDLFPTPFSVGSFNNRLIPGVVIHAQLTRQVLEAVLDGQRLPWFWPNWLEMGWIALWSLGGGLLAITLRHPVSAGLGSLMALGLCAGMGYWAFMNGGWIPVAAPIVGFVISVGAVLLVDRYAQPISNQIKGFLKIDIDINQEETETAVEEITGTEFFEQLREKGQQLRQQKEEQPPGAVKPKPQPSESLNLASDLPPHAPTSVPQSPTTPSPNDDPSSTPAPSEPDNLDDYFTDLRQRGQSQRRRPPKPKTDEEPPHLEDHRL